MALSMTRKVGDMIRIGPKVRVTVMRCRATDVRLLFEAPPDISIDMEIPPHLLSGHDAPCEPPRHSS